MIAYNLPKLPPFLGPPNSQEALQKEGNPKIFQKMKQESNKQPWQIRDERFFWTVDFAWSY